MSGPERDMLITRLNGAFPVRMLVTFAKALGWLIPFRNASALFFFFPFFHVGGAEKVHADIVGCFSGKRPWVFFTKKSENRSFRALFPQEARLFNIWPLLKYGYPFSVGVMAGFINRHRKAAVFGCNSLFYYLLVPYLAPHVRRSDLLHAFGGASDEFSLPVAGRLDRRVVISRKTKQDLTDQYLANGVDAAMLERVVVIQNRVETPENCSEKASRPELNVLFVGRGTPEKRVHLIGRAASLCRERRMPVRFVLVGDTLGAVDAGDRENCVFTGEVCDERVLEDLYAGADLLLLTSSREGFPLVIMEAMARGVVPLSTNVGGISEHVTHGVNGLLLESSDEDGIVAEIAATVSRLAADRRELAELSRSARGYARLHFGGEGFCEAYRNVILGRDGGGGSCPG